MLVSQARPFTCSLCEGYSLHTLTSKRNRISAKQQEDYQLLGRGGREIGVLLQVQWGIFPTNLMTTTSQNARLARQIYQSFQSSVGNGCTIYDATNDLAFCHLCMIGAKLSRSSASAFIFSGFSNWKYATRCFNKHEGSLKLETF